MSEQQSSYRQIMKATSLFGGVQMFVILIAIIRSKFIAILLGPVGMGIFGLFSTTIAIIASLTNFGLETSAIKDLSAANALGNDIRISIVTKVIRRLVWMTGLLGSLVLLVFSPWLSQITFGNKEYTFAFIWISITLLLNQVSSGQTILLRGMRRLKYMAQAGMLGSLFGLITTIPLYYFYGNKGIVPGIIITSFITLLVSRFYANKIKIKTIYVSKVRTIAEAKDMMVMGFMISLSGLIALGGSYIVRIFISNNGGIGQVGLYTAGFAIINNYVGMIFTAMSIDYYPRLASVANNNKESKKVINQQAEIALLILAPIILVFLVFINWGVILLYSKEFIGINNMILWAALGMFFKAASWSIAFVFLAKGASKLYFWNELVANAYVLVLNILGFKYGGLTGLGISFVISYALYLIQVLIIAKYKYNFSFNNDFYKIFGFQLTLAIICFTVVKMIISPFSYVFGSIIIIISVFHAYKELDKKIDISNYINKYLIKKHE